MIEAVVLDMDGTLIDSVDLHAESWRRALADYGKDVPFQKVRDQIGKGGDQLLPVFLTKEEQRKFGKDLEKHRGELFKKEFLPAVRPFPQARELVLRMKRDGLRLALGSSAKEDELKVYKEIAGVEDLFETATSADDVEKSKPHPDVFEAAVRRLGRVKPERAVSVGDTPYDAEAARKAGLRAVGVLAGGFPEDDLRRAGCMAIYRDPADLLARYEDSVFFREKPALSRP